MSSSLSSPINIIRPKNTIWVPSRQATSRTVDIGSYESLGGIAGAEMNKASHSPKAKFQKLGFARFDVNIGKVVTVSEDEKDEGISLPVDQDKCVNL
jgi:hypothetical protein